MLTLLSDLCICARLLSICLGRRNCSCRCCPVGGQVSLRLCCIGLRVCCAGLCVCRISLRLCGVGLRLLLQACSIVSLRLRSCLRVARRLALICQTIRVNSFDRDLARVFSRLNRRSGGSNQGLFVDVLVYRVRIGAVHQLYSMLVARAGIGLSTLGLSDPERIPRLVELQRQAGVQNHGVELVSGGNVAATLQELVLRIHFLACSLCICAYDVLKDDDVAGLPNSVVRSEERRVGKNRR